MTRTRTRAHRRPTITDVARAAGVSTAVVSYALNDRPGVSAATRERVLRVAEEFGWRPSVAARSVRGGPQTVTLAVSGAAGSIAHDPDFLEFVSAVTDVLHERGLTLAMHVAERAEDTGRTFRTWWAERRFDAVIVPDVRVDDPRVVELCRIGAPTVVMAPWPAVAGLASVYLDEDAVAARVGAAVLELGHRRVAAVTGPTDLVRTRLRVDALRRTVADLGGRLEHRAVDASVDGAAAATHALLTAPEPPSAIVYDSDTGALAGLDVARRCGLQVPWDVSVVAVGDSALCRLSTPAITVLPVPMAALGSAVGHAAHAALDGLTGHRAVVPVAGLVRRGSTSPCVLTGVND